MLILIGILLFVAFAIWITRARKRMDQEYDTFIIKYQFAPARDCPAELMVQGGSSPYTETQCLRGSLRVDLPANLILRTTYLRNPKLVTDPDESLRVTEQAHRFISFYLPPTVQLENSWIEKWKQELNKTIPKPDRTLVKIERMKDGGLFIEWKVYHNYYAAWLNAVTNDLLHTMPNQGRQPT